MIITRTPFRMSFFGGGTDLPSHFLKHGGAVLGTTFDKYCYVSVRHLTAFFDYSTELVYSKTERVRCVDQIQHPAIREAMRMVGVNDIRLSYEADLPARSGLGTSSSFAVGMLSALHGIKGEFRDKRALADEAIHLERDLCHEAGGWQDQIAASFGGMNRIDFDSEGYRVTPIIMSTKRKKELEERLLLFFTGFTRFSADVQKNIRFDKCASRLEEMRSLVDAAQRILQDSTIPLSDFGVLLDRTWRLKRTIGESVTTEAIDLLYLRALSAGAVGGKLLGAGGGGFLLLYVEPENQERVRGAFPDLLEVPFAFENGGTQVTYYLAED